MTVAFDQLTLGNSDPLAVTTLTINSTSVGSNRLAIIFVTASGALEEHERISLLEVLSCQL